MRRELSLSLILGCFLVLLLEAPGVLRDLGRDLEGPYSAWSPSAEDARPFAFLGGAGSAMGSVASSAPAPSVPLDTSSAGGANASAVHTSTQPADPFAGLSGAPGVPPIEPHQAGVLAGLPELGTPEAFQLGRSGLGRR